MTDNKHPITPPPELIEKWHSTSPLDRSVTVATQAARWGADQELEACVEWLINEGHEYEHIALQNDRRPNPPSLKEQALQAAQRFYAKGHENCTDEEVKDDFDTIRRALEALDD